MASLRMAPLSNDFGAPVVRNLVRTKRPIGVVLTVREVADRLRLCRATVYAMCERGELEHFRMSNSVRIEEAVLTAYFAKQRRSRRRHHPKAAQLSAGSIISRRQVDEGDRDR